MRKRRLLLGAGKLAVLGVAVFLIYSWAFPPAPGVTIENFRRLHVGMTEGEVEAIFGGPPAYPKLFVTGQGTCKLWQGKGVRAEVVIDDNGMVAWADFRYDFKPDGRYKYTNLNEGTFRHRLRAWLGW